MVRFVNYSQEYYQEVCDFLIELNEVNQYHNNWNWARFEWMREHLLTKKEQLNTMGLWFDDNHLVGAALIDMYFGEAFVGVLPTHQYLYSEVLEYAFNHLKDDQGLGIAIHDDNKVEIEEVLKYGFYKEEATETDSEILLVKDFKVELPNGFSAEEFDTEANPKEFEWLMYQGFNNGNDYEKFESEYQKPLQKRPHFNKHLCIVIKNQSGDLVATATTWYDEKVDYAYLEPVCVLPEYRGLGLGKTAVYMTMNHARELGAKRVIVNSGQEFYKRLGFAVKNHYSFYWKKEERIVNGKTYKLERMLGKGKGGYSYLAKQDNQEYVLKQIHHEPCDYYKFGNKIEAERHDYQRLLNAGIRIPKMVDIDIEKEIIIKEYIDGPVIMDLVNDGVDVSEYISQVREMAELAKKVNLNIDYYPTNFVVRGGLLYYIDYECNEYMDEWNLDNWGMKYWVK